MNSTLVHPAVRSDVGALLREWRQRRRMSQLDLAGVADVSTRHLSFVESGRSLPSRDMLMRLAEQLDVPLRGATRCSSRPVMRRFIASARWPIRNFPLPGVLSISCSKGMSRIPRSRSIVIGR